MTQVHSVVVAHDAKRAKCCFTTEPEGKHRNQELITLKILHEALK